MRLAVGTVRAAKVAAVRRALERLAPWPGEAVELAPVAVPSGVSPMPLDEVEGVRGAVQRARAALERTAAGLALGLEGGCVVLRRDPPLLLLRNWVAAWDGGRLGIGCGPGIALPPPLARAVLEGRELGEAIDRFAGERDVRSGRGTFGVLTGDRIDRAEAFAQAVVAALAPWYAPDPAWAGLGGT